MTRVIVVPVRLDTHRESFDLFAAGDLHYNDPGYVHESFINWRDSVVENVEYGRKTYSVLMGDYCSVFPEGDKRKVPLNPNADPLKLYTDIRNWIKPIKDTNVCTLIGNHDLDWWNKENINFVNWICAELNLNYGDFESVIRFKIYREGQERATRNIDVVVWHGQGSARTRGGVWNAAARPFDIYRRIDMILAGHFHRLGKLNEQCIEPDEDTLDIKTVNQFIVLTGGYQKGYIPETSTYISRKMLPPVTIGGVKLTITPFKGSFGSDILDVTLQQIY